MFLTKIEAKNFRNYQNLYLDSFSAINIFTGDNGHGKTSLLEAMYFALRGRSFKPYTGNHFIKEGEAGGTVKLDFKEEEGASQVAASFSRVGAGFKKELKYCGKKATLSFLNKKIPLFIFTDQSLKAIRQAPSERRDFVDQILSGQGWENLINKFTRVLKAKNSLLKNYKKKLISFQELTKTLEVLNESFLKIAFQLTKKRLEILQDLFVNTQTMRVEFFPKPLPTLGFKYQIHGRDVFNDEEGLLKILREDLEQKKAAEIHAALSLSGPHKHEIIFLYNGQDSRIHCSQGQQRTLLLTLLGTQLNKAEKTLLFLDDVLVELDDKNQEKLLYFLEKIPCQTFITNCKKTQIKLKKMSFFYVKNGRIQVLYV